MMSAYDFDEIIDRRNTNCVKYDFSSRFGKSEEEIPLWVADMDFKAPQEVTDCLAQKVAHGIYGYTDAGAEYAEVIKSWFYNRFNWEPQEEWLVRSPGVVFAISSAVRAFTAPGDAVMIQQPVYHPFAGCVTENGRRLVNNELINNNGRYEMDLPDFERKAAQEKVKLFLLCSPHNPVGRVWSREELAAVAAICERHGILVVSDEIHCDFTYPGHAHTVFASLSEYWAQHSIVCTAPSKTFNLAGLQVSNIFAANEELRRKLKREIRLTGYEELNLFGQAACQAAYRYGAPWLDALKQYLQQNVAFVRSFLAERLPMITMTEPEGTYLLWLDFSALGMQEKELVEFLDGRAGIWLNAGSAFGEKSALHQRMNIACPRAVLERAMQQLARAVDELEI